MHPPDADEALRAHICVAYLRSLRIVAVRWLAVAAARACVGGPVRSTLSP